MNLNWPRFNKYLYKYWKLEAAVIALELIILPLSLLNPYIAKLIIDKAYGNKDLELFFILAAIGGSILIFNDLIHSFASYLAKRINQYVNFDISRDLFRHLQRLPLSFFDNRSSGEHLYKINADVKSVSASACDNLPRAIVLFPRLIFILIIVFYLNWKLALFATLLVPFTYIQPYFSAKWLKKIFETIILKAQDLFKELQEVFSHMHLVKALGKEKREIEKFEDNLRKITELELREAKISKISSFFNFSLSKALAGAIALYGGYLVIKGVMSLGSLTAIMIYLMQLIEISKSIGDFYENIAINSVTRQRLAEILDIKPNICDADNTLPHIIKKGSIEFKEVSFGYDDKNFILNDISFSITPAAKIALVGASGCGKTTVLSLVLRLYEAQKGAILIDGLDTKQMKLDALKSQIGIALQEPFLWYDTVANNILYSAEKATAADMVKAAKLSQADDFILSFPDKYNTVIGEMACKLSEGQKQRIAIARALIKRPKILILDEAMSSLDSDSEDKIVDNVLREFKDSTIIMVSHRLSTVKKMDLVYFLESPANIEVGAHRQLLEKNQKYRELFASQIENSSGILK